MRTPNLLHTYHEPFKRICVPQVDLQPESARSARERAATSCRER